MEHRVFFLTGATEGTTGQAIAAKLLEELNICGLSLSKLRGQYFDGAGNMARRLSSHALNLCIIGATDSVLVMNIWCGINEVSRFFSNSPKRQQCLCSNGPEITILVAKH